MSRGSPQVDVSRRAPRSAAIESKRIRTIAERMIDALDLGEVELSILLTDDATIRELNREHRRIDRPTDVLAFPQGGSETSPPGAPRSLGDVVVSIDTAVRQAEKQGHSLLDEVVHLLAHGLLHLVGYDHRDDAEEEAMNAEARRIIARARAITPPRKTLASSLRNRR